MSRREKYSIPPSGEEIAALSVATGVGAGLTALGEIAHHGSQKWIEFFNGTRSFGDMPVVDVMDGIVAAGATGFALVLAGKMLSALKHNLAERRSRRV